MEEQAEHQRAWVMITVSALQKKKKKKVYENGEQSFGGEKYHLWKCGWGTVFLSLTHSIKEEGKVQDAQAPGQGRTGCSTPQQQEKLSVLCSVSAQNLDSVTLTKGLKWKWEHRECIYKIKVGTTITIKKKKSKKNPKRSHSLLWKCPYLAFHMHRAWKKWELRALPLLICRWL